jgi:hypothetical protein
MPEVLDLDMQGHLSIGSNIQHRRELDALRDNDIPLACKVLDSARTRECYEKAKLEPVMSKSTMTHIFLSVLFIATIPCVQAYLNKASPYRPLDNRSRFLTSHQWAMNQSAHPQNHRN